jgi:hypothetical protein
MGAKRVSPVRRIVRLTVELDELRGEGPYIALGLCGTTGLPQGDDGECAIHKTKACIRGYHLNDDEPRPDRKEEPEHDHDQQ